MGIGGRIKFLAEQKNVSNADIARAAGVSRSAVTKWFNGTSQPKAEVLPKLAILFGTPLDYFLEDEGRSDMILVNYPEEYWRQKEPVYDCAAGQGRINGEHATDTIDDATSNDEYSFVRIHGDSMLPVLQDGDIVKVHHQSETTPSDFAVVKVDGESATVKHVEIVDNGVWMRAENKEVYEDTFFSIQEVMTLPVTIIGKAVEVRRAL